MIEGEAASSEPVVKSRSEITKSIIDSESYWGIPPRSCHDIGRMGCHDVPRPSRVEHEPQPGEPYYTISMDIKTGEITVTNFDGEGNQL